MHLKLFSLSVILWQITEIIWRFEPHVCLKKLTFLLSLCLDWNFLYTIHFPLYVFQNIFCWFARLYFFIFSQVESHVFNIVLFLKTNNRNIVCFCAGSSRVKSKELVETAVCPLSVTERLMGKNTPPSSSWRSLEELTVWEAPDIWTLVVAQGAVLHGGGGSGWCPGWPKDSPPPTCWIPNTRDAPVLQWNIPAKNAWHKTRLHPPPFKKRQSSQ